MLFWMRKRARSRLWSFCWIIAIFGCSTAVSTSDRLRLTTPDTHAALTRNLTITLRRTRDRFSSLIISTSRYSDFVSDYFLASGDNATGVVQCTNRLDWRPAEATKLDFEIPCYCFDQAGLYAIRIYHSSGTLVASKNLDVRWPSIILRLPTDRSVSATDPVTLQIALSESDRFLCPLFDRPDRTPHQDIVRNFREFSHYLNDRSQNANRNHAHKPIDSDQDHADRFPITGVSNTKIANGSDDSDNKIELGPIPNYDTVISIRRFSSENETDPIFKDILFPVSDWWTLVNSTISLPCEVFIHPGFFRVDLLIRNHSDQSIIRDQRPIDSRSILLSRSNAMLVTPSNLSEDYELRVVGHYVYPCPPDKGLPISYRRPTAAQCVRSLKYDALRLYAAQPRKIDQKPKGKHFNAEEIFLTLKHNYVAEEKLPSGQDVDASKRVSSAGVAYFGCNHFDLIYPEYCFQLVSVYEDGAVLERARHCIPTQSTKYSPVHGQWSSWQSWGSCTVTCGQLGVQHRIRYCNQPEPSDGGQFCLGNGFETRTCPLELCPASPEATTASTNQSIPSPLASADDRCSCGCNVSRPAGGVIAIDSYRCTNNLTHWRIFAPARYYAIELKILKITFRQPAVEWLRVREYIDPSNPSNSGFLLFDSSITAPATRPPDLVVRSRSDEILIEHFSSIKIRRSDGNLSTFRKTGTPENWYGVLVKYEFVFSIDQRPIDHDQGVPYWWSRVKSDSRWFPIFIVSVSLTALVCLGLIYFAATRYTLKKLRSKCHYLMLLSQTTQASTIAGHSMGHTGSPSSIARTPICEIVSIRKNEHQLETSTKEPLLSRINRRSDFEVDDQRKSILKPKFQPSCKNLAQIPEEIMQTSTNTETTRLSGATQSPSPASPRRPANANFAPKSTPKSVRSIGIQLSSPALGGLRRHVSSDRCHPLSNGNGTIGQKMPVSSSSVASASAAARPESPNFSFAGTEQDDFEYDYYDAPVPGSFFNYQHTQLGANGWRSSFFETDIDIDDIIDQSDLMKSTSNNNNNSLSSNSNGHESLAPPSPAATMVSVSTQSHPVLAGGDSAESSEWSFKWTKPGTATTQFHFL